MTRNSKLGTKLVRSTSLVLALTMALGITWNVYREKKQARLELIEQSRVIAAQMLALRQVTAENQGRINYDSNGNFEFKHLNPAALVQQVNRVFNASTNYRVRQVSLTPRLKENEPNSFEKEKLLILEQKRDSKEVWGEEQLNGENYFCYMIPLYITTPCLSCHGDPKGEIDISGNRKEGYKVGDLAGALTILIPMKLKEASLTSSIQLSIFFTVLAILFSAAVINFHTNLFVSKPIANLTTLSQELGKGRLFSPISSFKAYGEIRELTERFADMACRLQEMYDKLEHKVAERTQELVKANSEIARVSQYKSEFLANMSHELRTPLTAILAFTEELLKETVGQLTFEQEDYLREIQDSGQQLLDLINDLLDLSKIESGKMFLDLAEVRIGEITQQVEKILHPLAEQKGLQIELNVTDSKTVIADRKNVGHVIRNLLSNAIKFSPTGQKIQVTVADTFEPEEGALVTVIDYGAGISEKSQKRIFDAFYQGDQGLNKEFRGTGLGLALAKKIVDLHLGWIRVDSIVGQGATFTVFWPTYPPFDIGIE